MAALRLAGFDGLIPRMSPTLMGDQFAQVASNVKLYSKELRYWRGPKLTYTPPPAAYQTLYRLFSSAGASAFLLWTNVVDVAVSPGADPNGETRIYYTGDGAPKKTNWAMATGGAEPYPSTSMPMGVTAPTVAPTLALTPDGTGVVETRAYAYTVVSKFGQVSAESAPSPPSTINVKPVGATVVVSGFGAPVTAENITTRRIYRTVVGATTTDYEFVAEIPVATTSFNDNLTVAQLQNVIPSVGWLPPPVDLIGLIALPGGSLCGFVNNTVYFSEPYYPHAWPLAYAINIPVMKIVGLAAVGSSVAVMTGTSPYFIHGGEPGQMYVEKVQMQEPCTDKSTIAADEDGVVYASPNGLVILSANQRSLATTNLFTADEWRPMVPTNMKAAILEGRYFGVFPGESPPRALLLSRTDPPALSFMQLPARALHTDARNGLLFFVHDTDFRVYQLDADEAAPLAYEWKSKRFFSETAQTYSLLRVDADYSQLGNDATYAQDLQDAIDHNTAAFAAGDLMGSINAVPLNTWDINGSVLWNLPGRFSSRTLQIILRGDDDVIQATLRPFSLDPLRVPSFKSREFTVDILGNIPVRSVHLATTIEELHGT